MGKLSTNKQRLIPIGQCVLNKIKYYQNPSELRGLVTRQSQPTELTPASISKEYNAWLKEITSFDEIGVLDNQGIDFSMSNPSPSDGEFEKIADNTIKILDFLENYIDQTTPALSQNKYLKSIYLITPSVALSEVIFLVLDEYFDLPIRFATANKKGDPTSIKKLHDIAYSFYSADSYPPDGLGKKVDYSKRLADNINNGLFKKRAVKAYMETNKLKKPTLVKMSEDKKILVLTNNTPVKTSTIKKVPLQFQSLYMDQTS